MSLLSVLWRTKGGERRIFHHHDGWKRHWLHVGEHCLSLELGWLPRSAWAEASWGEMHVEGFQVSVGFWFGVWLTWQVPWSLRRRFGRLWPKNEREAGLKWVFGDLRLMLFHDPWDSGGRGVYNYCVTLWRNGWVMGRAQHSVRTLMPVHTMKLDVGWWPLDSYWVGVELEERTWKRRFSTTRRISYVMSVADGMTAPPVPGKGENSWDCGDDAIYGMGVGIEDVSGLDGAMKHFTRRVEEARLRYASRNWRPARGVV